MPGTDPREAVTQVLDLVPFPYLPELPARGAHADLAGRGTTLLAGLFVDVQPSGWRITPRPSRDGQRAKDFLSRDLDALEEATQTQRPEFLKVQTTGPWTLAALLELHRGAKLLSDHGAVRDLASSLAEGLRLHLADLQRRLPGTTLVLQVDEPALPGVLSAQIPTSSGFGTLRIPPMQIVRERLLEVLGVTTHTVLHCCAPRPPIHLLRLATAISVDVAMLDAQGDDELGQALEEGTGLLLGVVPGVDAPLPSVREVLETVGRLRDRVGLTDVVLTPTCGLAGASSRHAQAALQRCAEAGLALHDEQ